MPTIQQYINDTLVEAEIDMCVTDLSKCYDCCITYTNGCVLWHSKGSMENYVWCCPNDVEPPVLDCGTLKFQKCIAMCTSKAFEHDNIAGDNPTLTHADLMALAPDATYFIKSIEYDLKPIGGVASSGEVATDCSSTITYCGESVVLEGGGSQSYCDDEGTCGVQTPIKDDWTATAITGSLAILNVKFCQAPTYDTDC